MLAVYDCELITNNYTDNFYFQRRLILNVKRQTVLKLYFINFNKLLINQTFIKLNLKKWIKTSSKKFKKHKSVKLFFKI